MDPNQKQQVVERLKTANNVLITVSSNPTVDQLAACIGFTLLMNKLGKHATAVFSGAIPSTLEFLQPEKTIESNTDSLRDFIIALDKSKADKLRYKVEDEVVRIFITPYRTSLSEKDLEFSQGDFNVDAVLAIGVANKEAIDQAIVAHGRILHDATVMTVMNGPAPSDVGSINWHDPSASSLSEMLVSITESFGSGLLDPQMATSFLTGIVAETERFSNDKTSPKVMTMSAQLMAAGANQQLIATKLTPVASEVSSVSQVPQAQSVQSAEEKPNDDGAIEIAHEESQLPPPPPETVTAAVNEDEIHIDDQGNLKLQEEIRAADEAKEKADREAAEAQKQSEQPQNEEPGVLGMPTSEESQDPGYIASSEHKVIAPLPDQVIDPLAGVMPQQNSSLPPIELPPIADEASTMPVAQPQQPIMPTAEVPAVDEARNAVMTAALDSAPRPQASQSVGAQIVPLDTPAPMPESSLPPTMPAVGDVLQQQANIIAPTEAPVTDPMAPPPVPPPMMPMPTAGPQIEQHHTYLSPTDQGQADVPTQL